MKIYVDYDTTLVNLIDPWVEWINERYSVNISSADINRWYYLGEVFGREADDFWRSDRYNHYTDKDILLPFDGAVDFLHALQSKFGKESVFIISSTKDHHKEEKIEHATHYFGISPKQFIPIAKSKFEVTGNSILIDDYPLHVMEHIKHNKQKGIVFNYKNRFGWCRECNYELDDTLTDYMDILDNSYFSIATSYQQILEELNNG